MRVAGRTIIVGAMVLAGRRLTAPQLVRLLEPMGLSATNVKSHLTRLVREGVLERTGPRRATTYVPSPNQTRIIEGIRSRLMEKPDHEWDCTWLMLTLRLPPERAARARLRASLWFDGFRMVSADVFVRPSWPMPWADHRVRFYLGMTGGVCVRGELVGRNDLARLYDLNGLNAQAERVAKWIKSRTAGVDSPRAAFVELMIVGGRVAQFIGHDPRLPAIVWGQRFGMVEVVRRFRHFEDRMARKAERFVTSVCAA